MKIMLGSDTYAPNVNGAARFTERLADGLAARGHEVHVVAPSVTGKPGTERRGEVTVHRIVSHRCPTHAEMQICFPWQAGPATAALVDRIQPDLVHVQAHFVIGRGLAAAASATGRPLVATNHFMPENMFGYVKVPRPLRRRAARWGWRDLARVFAQADVVTAPTPRAIELLEKSAGIEGAIAVSCGIDGNKYREATAAAVKPIRPTVLFVGRLDQEKRVDELIKAFAALPTNISADLEIIGQGNTYESNVALADRLGIGDRVRFRGQVSEQELLEAYGRSALFCMPGIAELQSLVTLEAMSAGKPVIAADAMALPHLVKPGRNGWLFTPGNIDQLTQQLATLLGDADLRRRMGAASQEIVARHEIGATLDTFEGIYGGVLGRRLALSGDLVGSVARAA